MDFNQKIQKMNELLTTGRDVLATRRPNPPNVIGFPTLDTGAFNAWRTKSIVALRSIFGEKHTYPKEFEACVTQGFPGNVQAGIGIIESAKSDLVADSQATVLPKVPSSPSEPIRSNKIFIVHGHDDGMKEAVARTLQGLGFEGVILHEQTNRGRTVIEKFEAHADVGFAVVLLSPDDKGFKNGTPAKSAQPRARQNVIIELGYFVGKLGRSNVMALQRGLLELPSDFTGVVYTTYDDAGQWRTELASELRAAGYQINANDLLKR